MDLYQKDVYIIYENGSVFHAFKNRFLKVSNVSGYHTITLTIDGKREMYYVHRLLALAFIPNPNNKATVNHINGIKNDNRLENLEWCTQKENIRHAWRIGLCKSNFKPNFNTHGFKGKPCIVNGIECKTITEAAKQFGKSQSHFSHIINNYKKSSKYQISFV